MSSKQELIDYVLSLTEEQLDKVIARMDELKLLVAEAPANH